MDHGHNHGGSWKGTPTYAEQKGNYPFVAEHVDVVKGWLDGDFKTKRMFFEYYWGLDEKRDDLDPQKNHLIKTIKNWEDEGATVEHILICREYRLAIHRRHKDAKPGPFKEDTRILYEEDVDNIRAMFRAAHNQGLPKHHPRMHYYLNTFPHMSARKRPVGPETDPNSTLGFTKWLIEGLGDRLHPPSRQAVDENGDESGLRVGARVGARA